jgi:adenylate cyclase
LRSSGTSGALARSVILWDKLRASPRLKGAFLLSIVAIILAAASTIPRLDDSLLAGAERFAFDQQMRFLREFHPRPLPDDVVLVGIDEETLQVFDEPIALWHRRFASVWHALAKAGPRAVGVDFVLPERSFDKISPGIDLAMMRGLLALKRSTLLVYVQTVDSQGNLVPVQPNFRSIITPDNVGIDQQFRDPDSVSRRFGHLRSADGQEIPTLVSQMLMGLSVPVGEGYIDYSIGAPIEYVPIHRIPEWDEAELRKVFQGRVVLVGSLVGFVDRWRLPAKLLAVDPGRPKNASANDPGAYTQPGVLIHLQALRSQLGPGLLHPVSGTVRWALCALAMLAVLVSGPPAALALAALLVPLPLVAASLVAIVKAQLLLPVASLVAAFWLSLIARGVFDASEAVIERMRLRQSFSGQVSPAVMQDMLSGSLSIEAGGELADVCILFSDIRDFTTLAENMPPQQVTAVLQRYFDRMVAAVHRYDGTVDKFIGDGMMAIFGAPRKSEDPCADSVQCALAMIGGLDELNAEFVREGLPTLAIGIGINYGTVTVGNIGSTERHNYSAIGDAVNVAARLEGLTKELGRKIVVTESVATRIGERFPFDALGSHKVKGHTPVKVWGIRTPAS